MKTSTDTTQYNTTINKTADFGIEDSDLSHIMGILRSQIYSDKLLAIIREYSTNAYDANVEARVDKPISVHLPTISRPELTIRDYGNGLSEQEVCNTYIKYGNSTKRESNDYTGCLGNGSKFDSHMVTAKIISYTDTHITTWLARIDESQRGTISMLNQVQNHTNETGVENSHAIKRDDIEDLCIQSP